MKKKFALPVSLAVAAALVWGQIGVGQAAIPPGYCPTAVTTISSTDRVPIPTAGARRIRIPVSGAKPFLVDLDATVRLFHRASSLDVDLFLTSPRGTVVQLSTDNSLGSQAFNGPTFDDDALVPVVSGGFETDLGRGRLIPEKALAAFFGENPNGTWILTVADDATGGDPMELRGYALQFTGADGPPATLATDVFSASPGIPIPDRFGQIEVPIEVDGLGSMINAVELKLALPHTYSGELHAALISPSGRRVLLFDGRGSSNDNVFNGTLFSDRATDAVLDTTYSNDVVKTLLLPERPLAGFFGDDPNGTWFLQVGDDGTGDVGTLDRYELSITHSAGNACPGGGPVVSSVSASSGSVDGGTELIVSGSGFQPGASLFVAGVRTQAVETLSSSMLTAVTGPSAEPFQGDVVVVNPDGRSAGLASAFLYVGPPPDIVFASAQMGTAGGGTQVSLRGSGLSTETMATFNGIPARLFSHDAGAVTLLSPPHVAGFAAIRVFNVDGQETFVDGGFTYTAAAAPTVSSASPNSGPRSGSQWVNVFGTGISPEATVRFGGTPAPETMYVSTTSIWALTPAALPVSVELRVTNPDGQSGTRVGAYTYNANALPMISSISPTSGPLQGGGHIRINGSNFTPLSSVTIGGTPATSVSYVSASALYAILPPRAEGTFDVTVTLPTAEFATLPLAYTYRPPPTVTAISPSSGPDAGGTTVLITGSGFDGGMTVRIGHALLSSPTVLTGEQLTGVTSGHGGGPATVEVTRLADGQVGRRVVGYFYGTPVVELTRISPTFGPTAGGNTVTLRGSGFVNGATTVRFGSALGNNVQVASYGRLTVEPPAGSTGPVDVTVQVGASSARIDGGYSYGTPVPDLAAIEPAVGPIDGGTEVTLSGSGFASGATVLFGDAGAARVSVHSGSRVVAVTPVHAAGPFDVTLSNPAGGSDTLTAAFTFEAPQPSLSALFPPSGVVDGGTQITLTGTGFLPGMSVVLGGAFATSISVGSPTQLIARTPPRPPGVAEVSVINPDGKTARLDGGFLYLEPLRLLAVAPAQGPASGGTPFVLTGEGFGPGVTAFFGQLPATLDAVTAREVRGRTPAHAAGDVDVTVRNLDGQEVFVRAAFTFVPSPLVLSTDPSAGPRSGGQLIRVTGAGFQPDAGVFFGLYPATSVVFDSSTQLSVVTPARPAGPATVVVANPDGQKGQLQSGYQFLPPPTLFDVAPTHGPATGGFTVTLRGSAFLDGGSVTFGGTASSQVSVLSTQEATAVAPPQSPGIVDVAFIGPDGQRSTLAASFTYDAPPAFTAFSPSSGPVSGGPTVSLTGGNFVSGLEVYFDGTPSPSVQATSSTTALVQLPPHPAGLSNVLLRNPDGQSATAQAAFRFSGSPAVSGVSPFFGPVGGGVQITLTGADFYPGATVSFGGVPSQDVNVVSPSTLTARLPAHTAGLADIRVTSTDGRFGTAPNAFEYLRPPALNSLTPSSGSGRGGTSTRLSGSDFTRDAGVLFNGVASSSVTFVSPNELRAVTPPGDGGVASVEVVNIDGQRSVLPRGFTYLTAPTVASLSPTTGSQAGGTLVTLTGEGFVPGSRFSFGGRIASNVNVQSETRVLLRTPSGTAGPVDLVIENPDGQTATVPDAFTYVAATDAGSNRDAGGGSVDAGAPPPSNDAPGGCGCSGASGAELLGFGALALLSALRRRRA